MKKVLFILLILILLFIPLIFAKSIQIDYPSSVKVNEEFSLNLKLIDFPADIYDIKIDINPEERIAQIYNNGIWKSTFYYVNDAISLPNSSNERNFKLKVIKDFQGIVPLEIKIKSSKDIASSFLNYTLNVEGIKIEQETTTENETEEEPEETEENISEDEIADDEELINVEEGSIVKISAKEIQEITEEEVKTIILTPKDIKSEIDKEQLSKNKLAIYGLVVFCILLVFLFIFKKRKKEKNEFR